MTDPLKTVFISYRLANSKQLAAYIDLYLRGHGYDVFRDVSSLDSGNFGQVILNQIAARTHFISILAPGSLERCSEPGDWVRRELEHAMHTGRNIVPVLAEGFTFGSTEAKTHLTGMLAHLTSYNALTLYYEYLDEGMEKLRTRFLQPPQVPVTITPVPTADALVAMREQAKAELQPAPTQAALTAEEYFNRAYNRPEHDYAGKIADYNEALRLKPDYAEAYTNRGTVRADQGDLTGALADYNEALRLKPDDAIAYYNRGVARKAQGDLAGALADYNEAIRLKPDDAIAYNNRGIARKAQGDLAGAIADYTRSIELKNPELHLPYNNRGVARQAQGDLAGALADYSEALRLKPDDATAYYNRGVARKAQGDLAGAIADYEQAIRLKPDYANPHAGLGDVYYQQNKYAEALNAYERVLQLPRTNVNYPVIEQRIAELRGKLGR